MKKTLIFLLSSLALVSLVACGTDSGSSSSSVMTGSETAGPSSSSSESSSSSVSSVSSSSTASKKVTLTLGKATAVNNTCFWESFQPSAIFTDLNGSTKDVTNLSNMTTWTIESADGTSTYGKYDSLPAGEYYAQASYKSVRSNKATFTVSEVVPETGSDGAGYYKVKGDFSSSYIGNFPQIATLGKGALPSTGNPKILVIPFYFSNIADFTDANLAKINSVFFGAAADTGWESLTSYYEKSSYGKLHIGGLVTQPYQATITTDQFTSSGQIPGLIQNALAYLQTSAGGSINLADYDSNGDGFLDGVEVIYKTNKTLKWGSQWWQFTSNTGNSAGTASSPTAERYIWETMSTFETDYYTPDIDAHTVIHENGHMMGLPDFYDYDQTSDGLSLEEPTGCVDMMDCNVGDQNAWSKMVLNWITPYVIDGTKDNFTITLNPYEDDGSVILLRNTAADPWNGTPYDEYIVLQYYTPTGLNEIDHLGYEEYKSITSLDHNITGGTYEKAGLQAFHIDARLYQPALTAYQYTDTPSSISALAASNTGSESVTINADGSETVGGLNRLQYILTSSGINSFASTTANNKFGYQGNLFTTQDVDSANAKIYGGDSDFFTMQKMTDFFPNDTLFNDGTELNWDFKVLTQSDSSITVQFINLAA